MAKLILLTDKSILVEQWISSQFTGVYDGAYVNTAMALNQGNPEKGLIALRSAIQDSPILQSIGQKFIITIRFYSFGDMASVDVVSLSKPYHKNIFAEHLKNLSWDYLENDSGRDMHAPYICFGAFIKLDESGEFILSGESCDYGSSLFGFEAIDIAAYILDACGTKSSNGDLQKGSEFISHLMDLIELHKQSDDFYNHFVSSAMNMSSSRIHPQVVSALTYMSAVDKLRLSDKTFYELLVEEVSSGIPAYVMKNSLHKK